METVLNGERGVTFRIIFKYLNIHESFPLPSKITRHSSPISFSNILIPTIFEFLYHIDYKKEGPASSINTLFILFLLSFEVEPSQFHIRLAFGIAAVKAARNHRPIRKE